MNQAILRPAPEQELPDWSRLDRRDRKDYKDFKRVPDFDQMLLNVANNKKVIPIRARYVYLPEQAGQIRSSIQAGLERLPTQPSREPPGQNHPLPQNPAPAAPATKPTQTTDSESQTSDPPKTTTYDLSFPPSPTYDDDMDRRGNDGGATSSATTADTLAQMLLAHQAQMAQATAVRDRAHQLELQAEMAAVQIRSDEQARRTAFVEQNVERMRLQPHVVPPPVVNYQTNNLIQPINTLVHNVQTNFNTVQNHVHQTHHNTVNFMQNNAHRAVNIMNNLGGSLTDAFTAATTPPPHASAAILDAVTTRN